MSPAVIGTAPPPSSRDNRLVDRGCVRPDQITDTRVAGAATICIYSRPYNGEARVGLTNINGTWKVVGFELN